MKEVERLSRIKCEKRRGGFRIHFKKEGYGKIEFVNYGVGADLSNDSLYCCFSGITGKGDVKVIA